MGPFAVAQFFGVRVEVFSLGFGKKIFKFQRGDTTYALSLIPLGGYVKMFGDETNASISEEEKKYSFSHKPVLQRIAVVLAGPMMNFFFAILIFFIVALIGEQMRAPVVGDISPDTPAYQMGFRSGDKIVRANEQAIQTWDDFVVSMTERSGQNLKIELLRAGSSQISLVEATPRLVPNPNVLSSVDRIGDIEGLSITAKASVVGVRSGSLAEKAGLRTGDLVKSVAGFPIRYFRELENVLVPLQDQKISIQVERFASPETSKSEIISVELPKSQFASLGPIGLESSDLYLAKIMEDSPAMTAGLQPGDRLLSVNNTSPKKWEDVMETVKSYKGEGTLEFQIERAGKKLIYDISPRMTSHMNTQGGEDKRFTVGIVPWALPAAPELMTVRSTSLGNALVRGYDRTLEITQMTVMSFLRLFQSKISPKSIGGVISIGQAASETFKMGISQFLQMMAVISVNLFILNLLPVPVLDGGHLLFYTIEALRGAPVSMRKLEIAQQIGLAVLMSLMVFALFNDFSRLIGSW